MKYKKPIIIFDKMTIENFGPFFGYHEFTFSKNDVKNVTLVLGEIGSGKTSIFQLFWWVLFPETAVTKKRKEIRFLRSKDTINVVNTNAINNANIDGIITIKGSLEFQKKSTSANITDYKIIRERSYKKKKDLRVHTSNSEEFIIDNSDLLEFIPDSDKVFITKDNKDITFTEYEILINQFFPPAIRNFAFIHGEGMTRILSIENVSELKKNILDISDFPKIEALGKYLKESKKYFDGKRKECAKDDIILQKKTNEINGARKILKNYKKRYKELENKFSTIHDDFLELTSALGQLQQDQDYIVEYKRIMDDIDALKIQRDGEMRGRRKMKGLIDKRSDILSFYTPYLYLEEEINLCLEDIKEKRDLGIIPGPNIPKYYLESILNRPDSCICGKLWDAKMEETLQTLIKESRDSNLVEVITKFEGWLISQKSNIRKGKIELAKIQQDLVDLNDRLNEKIEERRKFERSLTDEQKKKDYIKKIQEAYAKKEKLSHDLGKVESQLEDFDEKIADKLEKIEDLEKDYTKLETERMKRKGEKNAFYYKDLFNNTNVLLKLNTQVEKIIGKRIREETQIETKRILYQLVDKPDKWKNILIVEKGSGWLINAQFGESVITNLSTGMTNVLGLSFIFALSSIVEADLPLIFDSPLGNLDATTRELVAKNLPPIFKGRQIVFFEKEANLTGNRDDIGNIKDIYPDLTKHIEFEYRIQNPKMFDAQIIKKR